jgi:hypothetical protein
MTMRQRIDVDLDELDRIIDRSTHAPLSESEGQKLKTALHALAEGLARKRNTEKTKAVLPENAPAGKRIPANRLARTWAQWGAAFTGANRLPSHTPRSFGERCPECRQESLSVQKEPATLVRFMGTHRWKPPCSRWSDCAAMRVGGLHR